MVHPLVLLSVVDHYYRIAKDSKNKRVVGVLLGEVAQGRTDVTDSFAVPFEEDPRDARVFFLDHDFLETMFSMFRKARARPRLRFSGPPLSFCEPSLYSFFAARPFFTRPLFIRPAPRSPPRSASSAFTPPGPASGPRTRSWMRCSAAVATRRTRCS